MESDASRKKQQARTPLATACAVLPTNAESLPAELFRVSQTPFCSLGYPNERLDSVHTWAFDHLLNGPQEFLDSYKTTIAPLVRRTLRGEHAVVAFGGSVPIGPLEYMAAKSTTPGFLGLAARQLLESTTHLGEKLAKLTFAWFKIDAGSSEAITDVLRSSSTPGSGAGRGPDPALVLREVGKGRGLQVAGLWEVELANASDVEAILTHVTKIAPAATHFGDSHTVFQLIVTPIKTSTGNSIKSLDDGVPSRLSFLVLSNITSPSTMQTPAPMSGAAVPRAFPWVDQFGELLIWLESRRPSPPFHKSRVLLFLRDALMGKMNSALVLLIQPAQNMVVENNAWLRLWSKIRSVCQIRASIISSTLASSPSANKVASPGPRQASPGRAAGMMSPPPPPPPASPKPPSPAVSGLELSSATLYPAIIGSPRQKPSDSKQNGSTPFKGNQTSKRVPDSDDEYDLSFEAIQRRTPGPKSRQNETFQSTDENYMSQDVTNVEDTVQRSREIVSSLHPASASSPGRGGMQRKSFSGEPRLHEPLTVQGAMARLGGETPGRRPRSSSNASKNDLTNNNLTTQKSFAEVNTTLDPTDLTALLEALHASREENKTMKQALKASEDNVAYLNRQYEKLVTRVQEEGYFLRAKEREKLRKALQDLRDYELYKEVLESAMQRMNVEMDALVQQNRTLKDENTLHERNVRKQKIGVFKSSKEVEDAMKEVSAKERTIRELQDTLSTRTRERDEALATVAQIRLQAGRKDTDLTAKLTAQTAEKQAIKTKLDELQAKYRSAEQDRSKALDAAKQELEKLRASNRATLEKCSALQEENELLRASLSDIIDAQQQAMDASAS